MKSATGRWVNGDDFLNREKELALLESRIRDGNHILLTGQRRMGKTSLAQEIGRRLQAEGWVYLFTDVEDARCPEDVVAEIAQAVHPIRPIARPFGTVMKRWFDENIEETSALDYHVKIRAGLDSGSWRRYGEQLIGNCAEHEQQVLLAIDELPIFLKRLLREDDGVTRVEEFLSWFRRILQNHTDASLAIVVSGSIGLKPLVDRLGLSDRVNHLDPFRLSPWDRDTSVACFTRLATEYELRCEDGVAGAVYDALAVGIPHHIQSFFARLRDHATMHDRATVTVADVKYVYKYDLLGPSGQNDLVHYETRLKEGIDDDTYQIAMLVLAEAATQGVFGSEARRCLGHLFASVVDDVARRINDALDVLQHDGYLEASDTGYRFRSRLLRDWWLARFKDHHVPLCGRNVED